MPNDVQGFLAVAGPLMAVVALAAGALAYVKSSIDKATIVTLEKNADALEHRVEILEDENRQQATELAAVRKENAALLSQRPSADAIAELDRKLSEHDARMIQLLREPTK